MSKSQKAANAVDTYLNTRERSHRLAQLTAMQKMGETLPISLAEDLLSLPLGNEEHLRILETTGSQDKLALESFYTKCLTNGQQELASLAILLWRDHTDHLLWYQFYACADDPMLSQRVRYTLLDNLWHTGGQPVLEKILATEGIEDLSPAFHGLILHRALEWDHQTERLDKLAESVIKQLSTSLHPDNKAMVSALAYTARYHTKELTKLLRAPTLAEPWRDMVRTFANVIDQNAKQLEKLNKFATKPPKTKAGEKLDSLWPALWQRHTLDADCIAKCLEIFLQNPMAAAPHNPRRIRVSQPFEFFAGIPTATLLAVTASLEGEAYAQALSTFGNLLPMTLSESQKDKLKTSIASAEDPAAFLNVLPMRTRITLTTDPKDTDSPYGKLLSEADSVLSGASIKIHFRDDDSSQDVWAATRKPFFDAYKGQKVASLIKDTSYWGKLYQAWTQKDPTHLDELATLARQEEGPFRICYIDTLGRFQGHDQAALKMLDFIRSSEEDDIRAVIRALRGIGTPRAAQELVASLTRPNISHAQRLEICAVLQELDTTSLQKELRAAMNDLTVDPDVASSSYEVRESLAALLAPTSASNDAPQKAFTSSIQPEGASDQDLDNLLSKKIQNYRSLSSEVKRALRTAQFFHLHVSGSGAPESIDLSPVIDMQYKSLELFFREAFEDHCSRLIHRGVLQRRLDVIGYARPIPRAMDDFESYLSALPIIQQIPFFSKFKLRKMLRAICQFRPGRRFTLDGLKAFALFFLCFSRHECRYGLENLFPLGFKTDEELFTFCKELHILQDARNRAAHEGFHPDASNDIDGIWQATAKIIQTVHKIQEGLSNAAETYAPKNTSKPIIEKKVS